MLEVCGDELSLSFMPHAGRTQFSHTHTHVHVSMAAQSTALKHLCIHVFKSGLITDLCAHHTHTRAHTQLSGE